MLDDRIGLEGCHSAQQWELCHIQSDIGITGTGAVDAGAATWVSGTGPVTGVVTATNSLVGSSDDDHVGTGIIALTNGNYVVRSWCWNNGSTSWMRSSDMGKWRNRYNRT